MSGEPETEQINLEVDNVEFLRTSILLDVIGDLNVSNLFLLMNLNSPF